MANYDAQGREIPDPTPVSVPSGWNRPLTLQEQIRRFIREDASRAAAEAGEETWEEADDFDCEDDDDPLSVYEIPEARQEALGRNESLDGSLPPTPAEKTQPGPATQAAEASAPSTDSGTATPPAGGSSRS